MPKLIGVNRDYGNIIYAFNYKHGYDVVYLNEKSKDYELTYLDDQILCTSDIRDNFKMTWTKKDIMQFNTKILQFLSKNKRQYDGLLYFISCHGDSFDVIYDSNCNEIKFWSIIETFSNKNCPQLRSKPKIFFGDFCRGSMLPKRKTNSTFDSNKAPIRHENTRCDKDELKAEKSSKTAVKDPPSSNSIEYEEKSSVSSIQSNLSNASEASDIRVIYSNTAGYKVVDGGKKGGYLIRFFCKVIMNYSLFMKYDLNEQIGITRKIQERKIGILCNHVIDDWDRLQYKVKLVDSIDIITENKESKESKEADNKPYTRPVAMESVSDKKPFEARNPLIAMIGIGKYHKSSDMHDIRRAVYNNYKNVQTTFNCNRGYSIIYAVNKKSSSKKKINTNKSKDEQKNDNKSENKQSEQESIIPMSIKLCKPQSKKYMKKIQGNQIRYKLEWTDDEIEIFCSYIVENILNKTKNANCNYDSLIFIISSHGGQDMEIYDSFGVEYALSFIFDQFDNQNCHYFRNKPKIFIIDCERGIKDSLSVMNLNKNNNSNNNDTGTNKVDTSNSFHSESKTSNGSVSISNESSENNGGNQCTTPMIIAPKNNNCYNKLINTPYFMKDEHFCKIFATPEGYNLPPFDAANGTNLIYSFCQAMLQTKNYNYISNSHETFQEILSKVKGIAKKMIDKEKYAQIIVVNNRMPYSINLIQSIAKPKGHK